MGVEVTSACGAEVGVGAAVAGGGVAVAAVPQPMTSKANRVRDTAKTRLRIRIRLGALLSQVFDPLQVPHHVAAVVFAAASEYLACLIRVIDHRSSGGR